MVGSSDISVIEIGGTVGDYQNIMFIEAGYLYKHFRFLLNTQIRFSKSVYENNEINNLKLNIRYQF